MTSATLDRFLARLKYQACVCFPGLGLKSNKELIGCHYNIDVTIRTHGHILPYPLLWFMAFVVGTLLMTSFPYDLNSPPRTMRAGQQGGHFQTNFGLIPLCLMTKVCVVFGSVVLASSTDEQPTAMALPILFGGSSGASLTNSL